MSPCAMSLVFLELLAPDSSLSTMLIRVSLKAVRHSPPLGFPSHLATVQLLQWSHLYLPCTPPSLSFSYRGVERYLCMQVSNRGSSGPQFLASTTFHLAWRVTWDFMSNSWKAPKRSLGNILVSHTGEKVAAQCGGGTSPGFGWCKWYHKWQQTSL